MFRYSRPTLVREVLVVLAVLLFISPVYFLVNVSLKSSSDALRTSALEPAKNPSLSGFSEVLQATGQNDMVAGAMNSLIITVSTVVCLIVLGSITAYTLGRITTRMSKLTMTGFLVAITLPAQLGMLPIYVTMRSVGLVGTRTGVVILYTAMLLPLAVFLYSGFVRSLPRDYEEAAQMEGAGRFTVFRKIVFPLLAPATGTVAVLAGMIVWNDFFTPLVFLNGTDNVTLPVVVYSFVGQFVSQWNLVFAAVFLSALPMLIFYLFAQQKFFRGFAGGIK